MFKKLIFSFISLFFAASVFCQGVTPTPVEMLGKEKGVVNMLRQDGENFVEALPFAKTLKFQTSWFGRSGQLNLKGSGGYFAVLREGQNYAVVNGKNEILSSSPIMNGNKLYVPLSFFGKGSAGTASGYDVAFEGGKIIIEKFFTLEFLRSDNSVDSSKIIFGRKGNIMRETTPHGKSRVDIFFPGAVVKREETLYPTKNDFIEKMKTAQRFEGVSVNIFLKNGANFWDMYDDGARIVFEAAKDKISIPVGSAAQSAPAAKPVIDEALSLEPSVLSEESIDLGEDFFEEPEDLSVPTRANPIIKAAPPKTVINVLPSTLTKTELRPGRKTRKARILIDPGHGGKDPGATKRGSSKEKDINLQVAKDLYAVLRKDKDFDVKITRDDDTFVTLGGRAKMANDFKADIFVSIHANAAKRTSANGFEVYFRSDRASDAEAAETAALENEALQYEGQSGAPISFADLLLKSLATNENINESSKLAGHVRNSFAKKSGDIGIKTFPNSSIKQANFFVLKGVQAPSVLVEMGYLSNANDRKRLNTSSVRKKVAAAVSEGIVSYAKAEGWK